jgi:D-glycero-D-manno-heptose 1,7-bisphosphate phosphatase
MPGASEHQDLPPAVLIDRDGVINQRRSDYVRDWEQFALIDGAAEGIALLTSAGCPVAVVTNQSAVGRGLMTQAALDEIHARMVSTLASAGGVVSGVHTCVHIPESECPCRKPRPGLLLAALAALGRPAAGAWFIGDNRTDVLAARAAGTGSLLVLSGIEQTVPPDARPDLVASDLLSAATLLVQRVAS